MNNINKKKIRKKIELIRNKKKIFFKNYKIYYYDDFIKNLKSTEFIIDTLDKLSNGTIFILKNSIQDSFLDIMKDKLNKLSKKKKPINPRIKTGIKNGYYISNHLDNKGYKTVDRSFYFFSWNKDKTGIYNKIIEIYKPLKILNGINPNDITKNKPKDGIIERVHIINYPINSGLISQHYDPINVTVFNFGIYATQYGTDYTKGGFFVLKNKAKKILIDKQIKKTDSVLFFPSLVHGVSKVTNSNSKKSDGRWFVNVNHAQSHEVKNREYTKKF